MMNATKNKLYVDRIESCEANRSRAEWELAKALADLRAEWRPGVKGDDAFMEWCKTERGYTPQKSAEYLLRAGVSAEGVTEEQWRSLGGWSEIRALRDVTHAQWRSTLATALDEGKTMREVADGSGIIRSKKIPSAREHAEQLANYIAKLSRKPPPAIAKIVAIYVTTPALKSVA